MSEPDYAIFLIRAEEAFKPIYQHLIDNKGKAAFLAIVETRKQLDLLEEWLITHKAK